MKKKMAITLALYVILGLILILFFVRFFGHRELDDVSPGIQCDAELLRKADVLWVIPKFEGKNISGDREWCSGILAMNKKLGLHGVYHTYKEFNVDRDSGYLDDGISEFERCFGEKPAAFKAPQLALNEKNKEMIEDSGLKVRGMWNQLTHKVYHCEDSGLLPNWVIGLF